MKAKNKYLSPYTTELVVINNRSIVIQYLPTESKDYILAKRKMILAKRPEFDDLKITPYFETRAKNLVEKLYGCKTGAELVELLIKNANVTMSGHFRHRDVLDIVLAKQTELEFNENDKEIFSYIIKSLTVNNVIASKIRAIYMLLNGKTESSDE